MWLGAIFCFFIIPLLLVDTALSGMLRLRHEEECFRIFADMSDRLTFMSRQADEAHYFHQLLQHSFKRATGSHDPIKSLAGSIAQLKKAFPDNLRFIVWDSKGRCVEHLTDEKGYRYIVNNLQTFFYEIALHCRTNSPGTPEALPIVEKRIGLFRSYLGKFLVPSHLRLPFQAGELGRCILADTQERFPLFWFSADETLTFFCSIKPPVSGSNCGVSHAIRILNRDKDIITSGYIDMREVDRIYPDLPADEKRQIMLELGKFENASLPQRVTDSHLIAFKLLNSDLRGFCMTRRKDMSCGFPEQTKYLYFARILLCGAIALFVATCYCLRLKKLTISIRTRIALLFLYANGLPLMILETIGNEYLQQKEHALTEETHRQNEMLLQEIDSGYRRHRVVLGRQTKSLLQSFSGSVKTRLPDKNDQKTLQTIADQLGADEVAIFGRTGDTIVNFRKNRKTASQTFIKIFTTSSMAFANQQVTDFFSRDPDAQRTSIAITSQAIMRENTAVLKDLLGTMESVEDYTFGTDQKLCYACLLGDREKRLFHSTLLIFWLREESQAAYAAAQVARLGSNTSGRSHYASLAVHNGAISASNLSRPQQLRTILQKAWNLHSARDNHLQIDGKRHIVTAVAGRQLGNISLAAVVPADSIIEQIHQARTQMLLLALISLFIVSGVVTTLSRQFILPVRQLTEAVKQIGRRNFTFRTDIATNDEFGDLGRVFNATIEEMADLEIGKIVQKALFPGNRFKNGNVSIFARTRTMTKLGGDYYDFFPLASNKTGIFMGDVAGHGIPAALIMAMAKATVLANPDQLHDPTALLTSLHQMLFKLKSDGFKRMMTCQYLVMDNDSGRCSFANAGHCFPVIVGVEGTGSVFSEVIGSPVGIARRASYRNHEICLQPGETMILYSDGMLEAANARKEIFGAERFLKLACDCWNKDLATYYQNLFNANSSWAPEADDDITIVLIRFQPEKCHE
jgi:hypothetical protein